VLFQESFETTFQAFIHFWHCGTRILQYFDQTQYLDLILLHRAHRSDIAFLASGPVQPSQFPARCEELKVLENPDSGLELGELSLGRFICQTPFSYLIAAEDCVLEVMYPGIAGGAAFGEYTEMLQGMGEHPNIMKFRAATTRPPYCVAFETIADSLEVRLRQTSVSATMRSIVLLEVARALLFLHEQGIVHRFICPFVVFLTEDNRAQLGGMFLAARGPTTGTRPFSPYSAPELLANAGVCHPGSDIYAFTFLAWSLIANERPFRGMAPPAIMQGVVEHNARPPLQPNQPNVEFFARGWAREADSRWGARELVSMIESKTLLAPGTDRAAFDAVVATEGPAIATDPQP
jgi:hypothetical protein